MATTVTVTAGTTPVIVARCESSNGRPAANISWATVLNGNVLKPMKTDNADNTVTVQSTYMLAPQPADNGKDISCIVSHRTMSKPESFPMKLVVECKISIRPLTTPATTDPNAVTLSIPCCYS